MSTFIMVAFTWPLGTPALVASLLDTFMCVLSYST